MIYPFIKVEAKGVELSVEARAREYN